MFLLFTPPTTVRVPRRVATVNHTRPFFPPTQIKTEKSGRPCETRYLPILPKGSTSQNGYTDFEMGSAFYYFIEGPATIPNHIDGSRNQVEVTKFTWFLNQESNFQCYSVPVNFITWYVNPYLVNRNHQGIPGIKSGIKPRFCMISNHVDQNW